MERIGNCREHKLTRQFSLDRNLPQRRECRELPARDFKSLSIVVSVIALYEVWEYTIQHADRARALAVTDSMQQGDVVSIDPEIAIEAADLSVQRKIPMADSLIYITAQKRSARLWTQDEDFEGLPNVRYFPKIKA